MFILSQDERTAYNANRCTRIHIFESRVEMSLPNTGISVTLGEYGTKERAKEVFIDILEEMKRGTKVFYMYDN